MAQKIEYTIIKDCTNVITETLSNTNLTSATITWAIVPLTTDFTGDLDTVISSSAVVEKDNAGVGGVVITDAAGGVFQVTLDPADTASLTPSDNFWVIMRVTLSDSTIPPVGKYRIAISS
jgi:hypothetical protein